MQFTELGNDETVGVAGCNKQATYVFDISRNIWVMNQSISVSPEDTNGSKGGTP